MPDAPVLGHPGETVALDDAVFTAPCNGPLPLNPDCRQFS